MARQPQAPQNDILAGLYARRQISGAEYLAALAYRRAADRSEI